MRCGSFVFVIALQIVICQSVEEIFQEEGWGRQSECLWYFVGWYSQFAIAVGGSGGSEKGEYVGFFYIFRL